MSQIRILGVLWLIFSFLGGQSQTHSKPHPLDTFSFPLTPNQKVAFLKYADQNDPRIPDFLIQKISNPALQDTIFQQLNSISRDVMNSSPQAGSYIAETIILLAEHVEDSSYLGIGHMLQANYLADKGEFQSALAHNLKAMEIGKKINKPELRNTGLLGLSSIHYFLQDFQKSIDYLNQYITICEEINDEEGLAKAFLNISGPYYELGRLDKCEEYLEKSLAMARKQKDRVIEAYCLGNLANLYIDLGRIQEAIKMQTEGLALEEALDDKLAMIDSHGVLSECYAHLKNREMTDLHHKQSLALCAELGAGSKALDVYKESISIYKLLGDLDKALTFAQLHLELKDSLLITERNDQIAEMREKYETAEKESQIKDLEEARRIYELEVTQRRNQNIILVITLLLLLVIILSILFFYFQSTRQKRTLETQNNVIKAVNKQLEVSQQELSVANQTKDKFFALVAHDLRGPITAMQGVGDVLNYYLSKGDTTRVNLLIAQLDQSTQVVNQLLDNLLKWAMSQSDGIQFHAEKLQVTELITECTDLFHESLKAKNISLQTDLTPAVITGDKNMLSTVIRNLLNNAIKFTPADGEIRIITKAEDALTIRITDSGVGMSDDQLNQLFSLTKSTSTGTAGEKGTGLGLLLCQDFVLRHQGKIEVQSRQGSGTTFTITLPL